MDIFIGLALTIVIAALVAGILQKLKQPIIIGHILTGLIVGPYLLTNHNIGEVFDSLSQIGIALLLFIIGLSLTPKVIKEVGKASLLTGLGQILITMIAGFGVAKMLHFPTVASLYIGLALTFSSTIIIMKLLSDKHDLTKFYSKYSIGLLLVQDLLVAIILIGISAFSGGSASLENILITIIKGILVLDAILLFTIYALPRFTASFAKSQEFLFLFAIGWGLGIATLFHALGFSMEIGALIAGVALSTSPYHFEISSRLKPLRDFFVILFFILLGSRLNFAEIKNIWIPALVLSLFVVLIKPLLVMALTGLSGYRKKVMFFAGINFTQISEFSLILIILAEENGKVPASAISLMTLISLVTITVSSYLVLYNKKIYLIFEKFLLERKNTKKGRTSNEKFDVILFGCNRIGYDFVESFREIGDKFLVVDFDPEKITRLSEDKINCRYGDADDNEFLDELNLRSAKMVISTIPDFETNRFLIEKAKEANGEVIIFVISHDVDEAIGLYEAGASYVITPHFLGGKYASMLISKYGFDLNKFMTEKEKHLKDLQKRKEMGHVGAVSS